MIENSKIYGFLSKIGQFLLKIIDGSLLASIVFPEPGGPIISMLWYPAAAISIARFTFS